MAFAAPIDFQTIQSSLVFWVATATGLPVIWNGQNRTQVPRPFAELKKIAGPIKSADDEPRRRMGTGPQAGELFTDIVGSRGLTYNLQIFAASDKPSNANADTYISAAQAAVEHPTIRENFLAAGISVVDAVAVNDIDTVVGTGFDSRASLDLRIEVISNLVPAVDAPTNWIETATASGTAGTIEG